MSRIEELEAELAAEIAKSKQVVNIQEEVKPVLHNKKEPKTIEDILNPEDPRLWDWDMFPITQQEKDHYEESPSLHNGLENSVKYSRTVHAGLRAMWWELENYNPETDTRKY